MFEEPLSGEGQASGTVGWEKPGWWVRLQLQMRFSLTPQGGPEHDLHPEIRMLRPLQLL